jgi:membrane-associated phospholipid phosphatase
MKKYVPKKLLRTLSQPFPLRLVALTATDALNIVFFAVLSIGMLFCMDKIPPWWLFIAINGVIVFAVYWFAQYAARRGHFWNLLHGFYMMNCIPIAFKELYYLVPALHPHDYDSTLIAIDKLLFGVNPTLWLQQFSHPFLTEILQIAYASFYFLPLVLTVDLFRMKRMKAFKIVFFTIVLGFYLSYIGYVAFPAVGPRFTLHDFRKIDEELPGVFFTKILRAYTNIGESIPEGNENPLKTVQRDVFPSGHTEMTLLIIFLAWRYKARTRWPLTVTGSLLIIATVYLRYHYVIDLLGGAVFAFLTVLLSRFLLEKWDRFRDRMVILYD